MLILVACGGYEVTPVDSGVFSGSVTQYEIYDGNVIITVTKVLNDTNATELKFVANENINISPELIDKKVLVEYIGREEELTVDTYLHIYYNITKLTVLNE